MPKTWAKEQQEKLKNAKSYIKTDYKLHVQHESQCADHCRAHALSDSMPEFRQRCLHDHDVICDRCEALKTSLAEIESAISSDNINLRYAFLIIFF